MQRIHNYLLSLTKEKNNIKIFCIGNPKTGTRSLHKALKILGYKTPMLFDWPTYLKYGGEKYIENLKKSSYDAFADAPLYYNELYKKIEVAFPESKFILTLRENESFKKSYYNYFKVFKRSQNELLENIKYMQKRNDEIIHYFEGRNSNFLIMNIIEGDGWEKLCNFLHKPIPDKLFPHENKGKYK